MPEDDGIYFDYSYDMSDGDVGTLDFGTFPDFSTNSDFGPAYDMNQDPEAYSTLPPVSDRTADDAAGSDFWGRLFNIGTGAAETAAKKAADNALGSLFRPPQPSAAPGANQYNGPLPAVRTQGEAVTPRAQATIVKTSALKAAGGAMGGLPVWVWILLVAAVAFLVLR